MKKALLASAALAIFATSALGVATDVVLPMAHLNTSTSTIDFPGAPSGTWPVARIPIGTSGHVPVAADGNNTWSGSNAFTASPTGPNTSVGDNSSKLVNTASLLAQITNSLASIGAVQRGAIGGLTLSNDGTSPNTVLDIAAGQATSDDATTSMAPASAFTKTTGSWAVGTGNGALDAGAVAASTWYHVYLIERTDTQNVDLLMSQAPPPASGSTAVSSSVTCTSASPMVCTWGGSSMPFQSGAPIVLSGTTAPAGTSFGTQYYALNVSGLTFQLSATYGGSAINSTSTGTSVVATTSPILPSPYTKKRYIGSFETDASAHILTFVQIGDEYRWGTSTADVSTTTLGTTATLFALNVPIGVVVSAKMRGYVNGSAGVAVLINSSLDAVQSTSSPTGNFTANVVTASTSEAFGEIAVPTNNSQQIRAVASAASTTMHISTFGWVDTRGRFN